MDRFAETQARIEARRAELTARYPEIWAGMISEWQQPGLEDRAWLTYSANYLFRTGGIRWALDPLTLNGRLGEPPLENLAADLEPLSFVLLSHRHRDHLDIGLISALRDLPMRWVVPEFMQEEVRQRTGLPAGKIITPQLQQELILDGMQILPFEGNHWETLADGTSKGVPAMGYRVKFSDKCWLFPGDTRSYSPTQAPGNEPVDGLFAHVWLGRRGALLDKPPLLEDFCKFQLGFQPRRILLSHLHEVGRPGEEFWDERHADMVKERIRELNPGARVEVAFSGESVRL